MNFFLIGFLIIIILSTISFSIPTLIVEETELVKVKVDTFDPDNDETIVVYSAPLDENGEWRTDYGDAGNYTTMVTVTDGKSLTEEEILIIVKRKNRAPEIDIKSQIEILETEKVKLKPKITDPNGDEIKVGFSDPFNEEGEWQTGYDDAGEYTVTIRASDDEFESTRVVKIIVNDKNRLPKIAVQPEKESIQIKENEGFYFSAEATDEDNDDLFYLWNLNDEIISWESFYSFTTDYDGAGTYDLKLVVSDGIDEVVKNWQIEVENVNRPPKLPEFDDVVIDEGQKLILDLILTDEDGDALIYSIDEPIGDEMEWQTDYEDAGEYEIEIEVSDGELTDKGVLNVVVRNVDRAPEFEEIDLLEVNENEELHISLEAEDPDGDDIYYLAYGFPEGAALEENEIVWQPDYDFVAKPNNFPARLLGRLRLDRYLWQKKDFAVDLVACGRELCTNQTVMVRVNDINRLPELWVAEEVVINETDKIRIKPQAADPDGDIVKFYFTEPLDSKGMWQPDFDSEGEYNAIVGATDGKTSVEKTIKLIVNNLNRQPVLEEIKDRHANEGEEVWIKVEAEDPDNDELDLWVEGAPEDSSFQDQWFSWKPDYDTVEGRKGWFHDWLSNYKWLNRRLSQEKQYLGVNFVVSDGDFIISKLVDIAVRNWNQPPEIINATPDTLQVYVGEPVLFEVDAIDLDGDELEYTWDFGFMQGEVKNANAISRRFTSSGEKKISLVISDGRDFIEKEWKVVVGQKPVQEVVQQPTAPTVQPTFTTYVV